MYVILLFMSMICDVLQKRKAVLRALPLRHIAEATQGIEPWPRHPECMKCFSLWALLILSPKSESLLNNLRVPSPTLYFKLLGHCSLKLCIALFYEYYSFSVISTGALRAVVCSTVKIKLIIFVERM